MSLLLPLLLVFGEPDAEPRGEPDVEPEAEAGDDEQVDLGYVPATEGDTYGPFKAPEAPSDVQRPIEPPGSEGRPFLSVGQGAFCFLEDSFCRASLIVAADVGAGINIISGSRGFDVPYTQARILGGATVRPLYLARGRWHPWGLGLIGSWSIGAGTVAKGSGDIQAVERDFTESYRIGVVNQLWLNPRRNSAHFDLTLGGVNSSVFSSETGRFWGTHVDVAAGMGGWGALFMSGDFLDRDTRVVFGFRGHGIVAAPVAGLVILGLLAGGANLAVTSGGNG